ncbi:30S ribosomal protein S12 methylthiotransferase RimO [Clostridium sp. MSJ-8]|uniref:30S ribosomal protein S12 methylthiotransferase RimO n=1 Tax=Clostridium sp. MSJ-8 TaxID=2841510 RepID=UPI001C0EDE52|nr:30S ribosomal protein S12 methylthiotransferase RimO [Clostridium sp. MSJ-8]MBU5488695.1 30S ribosomal protein S12 methylthiotransferase RimO [Clostridium sp. MSJ-8]
MKNYKVGMVSLGCDKNRVDSEIMLGSMIKRYDITSNPKMADIIVVNTCGFIESAKQESIDTILEMAQYKETGKCKLLIATGCLIQRYGEELKELIPEIDIMLGVNNYNDMDTVINNFIDNDSKSININYSDENINEGERVLTTASHTAYMRIAEGCDNFCTYCAIPKIRGKFRSRKMENILKEAELLTSKGVKELILVAQDTTIYGRDLYGGNKLHVLLEELSKIEKIQWIRLLYCYPEELYPELIDEMASNKKIVKYIDLPIQHISSRILKLMGRKVTREDIIEKINYLRERIPSINIRTSLITGFPGETEEDFNEMKAFLDEYKLDKVGVFKYSQEEGTAAAKMANQIPEEVKEYRENELMMIQRQVSEKINELKINNIYDILVEGRNEDYYYGRNYEMIPEVDGSVFFKSNNDISIGSIVKVMITDTTEYDLIGVEVNESCE